MSIKTKNRGAKSSRKGNSQVYFEESDVRDVSHMQQGKSGMGEEAKDLKETIHGDIPHEEA